MNTDNNEVPVDVQDISSTIENDPLIISTGAQLLSETRKSETRLAEIEANILSLKQDVAHELILIGENLIEAKNLVKHGQWSKWLENKVGFSKRTAQNYMRLARTFPDIGVNHDLSNIETSKLFLLQEMSLDDRMVFLEDNDVRNMSVREMKEEIRRYKPALGTSVKPTLDTSVGTKEINSAETSSGSWNTEKEAGTADASEAADITKESYTWRESDGLKNDLTQEDDSASEYSNPTDYESRRMVELYEKFGKREPSSMPKYGLVVPLEHAPEGVNIRMPDSVYDEPPIEVYGVIPPDNLELRGKEEFAHVRSEIRKSMEYLCQRTTEVLREMTIASSCAENIEALKAMITECYNNIIDQLNKKYELSGSAYSDDEGDDCLDTDDYFESK